MKIFSALLVFFGTSSLVTIEVLHVLSELSELIELPEVFSSMKKCLFHGALRLGDPLIKLLKLRFVSLSSETSRSFQTSQSSQSSITSHPAFPDVLHTHRQQAHSNGGSQKNSRPRKTQLMMKLRG